MKKQLLYASVLVGLLAGTQQAQAQGDATAIIKAGKEDANKIMDAYMGPMFKGFASGLNLGWYNTAKPHGTGGFDITLSFGFFNVPTADQSYKFNDLGVGQGQYKYVPAPGTDPNAANPTIGGSKTPGGTYTLQYTDPTLGATVTLGDLPLPQGTGSSILPSVPPAAQLAIGIYKNTEVMVRFVPTITAGDFKAGLFGFGVKHDIKQWIPVIKEQKIWDWSAIFGYSSYSSEFGLTGGSKLDASGSDYQNAINAADYVGKAYDNQKFSFNGSGWMLGTVVSAKLLFFTPYLGINFNTAKTEFKMEGDYPILAMETDPNAPVGNIGKKKIIEVNNPLAIDGNVSGLRVTPGFRLKLLVFTLHYDFSWNTYGYNLHTAGVGINLQSIAPFKL